MATAKTERSPIAMPKPRIRFGYDGYHLQAIALRLLMLTGAIAVVAISTLFGGAMGFALSASAIGIFALHGR
jgi:hypothetical protein